MTIVLFEHIDFGGRSWTIQDDVANFVHHGWNDIVSSIEVREGEWEFCEHVDYGGRRWTLGPGRYRWVHDVGIPNDMLSSCRRVDRPFILNASLQAAWRQQEQALDALAAEKAELDQRLAELRARVGTAETEGAGRAAALARARASRAEAATALDEARVLREQAEREADRRRRALDALAAETLHERRLLDAATVEARREAALRAASEETLAAERNARAVADAALAAQAKLREDALAAVRAAEGSAAAARKALAEAAHRWADEEAAALAQLRERSLRERADALASLAARAEADLACALDAHARAAATDRDAALSEAGRRAAEERQRALGEQSRRLEESRAAALSEVTRRHAAPGVKDAFTAELEDPASGLRDLMDAPPSVPDAKVEELDARRTRVVLATVRDLDGRTAPGILVRLLSEDARPLDASRTDAAGIVLLRYPEKLRDGRELVGALEVRGPGDALTQVAFVLPAGAQHTVAELVLDRLPDERAPRGDDPLQRAPLDFTPALFDDLVRLMGEREDPFLRQEGREGFRGQRARLVRRVEVPRVGPRRGHGLPPRRYLARLRQEWVFLGYGLGELRGLEGLTPGEAAREATRTSESALTSATEEASRAASEASSLTESAESVASQAQAFASQWASSGTSTSSTVRNETSASSMGGGFSIPFLGGFGGGKAGATTTTRASASALFRSSAAQSSSQSASQTANAMTRSAQSTVNSQMRSAASTARSVRQDVARTLERVAPLLSRATNLVRWTLYENYAVCTRVESLQEVQAVRVTSLSSAPGQLFSAADVLEYRRIFAPGLLDPGFGVLFDHLWAVVQQGGAASREASGHPLVAHVNRNRTHYFGLLLEAALEDPSLRDDAPQLAAFHSGHPLWRLPILGFDGDKALLLRDPAPSDDFAQRLLADPGSATVVQVAAPGAYSEAVQGVRQLDDLKGMVPPQLQAVLNVVPGDYRVLDLAKPGSAAAAPGDLPAPDLPDAPPAVRAVPVEPPAPAAAPPTPSTPPVV